MPQVCKTCTHPDRQRIEAMVLSGSATPGAVARLFNMNPVSLRKHLRNHAAKAMAEAAAKRNGKAGKALLEKVEEYIGTAESILRGALGKHERAIAVKALRTAHDILRTQGELTGELGAKGSVHITLGVPVEVAAERLRVLDEARALPEAEVIERALACLERGELTPAQAERCAMVAERAGRVPAA